MSDPAASRTNDLAPLLQGFFTDKLMRQRQASPHTITAYRDAFKLLLQFTGQRIGRQPAQLGLADLDAALVGAFLQHLQASRGNSGSTRNARLGLASALAAPMQQIIVPNLSPSTKADSVASTDTGPPIWTPAYHFGVGTCGRRKST